MDERIGNRLSKSRIQRSQTCRPRVKGEALGCEGRAPREGLAFLFKVSNKGTAVKVTS